MTTTDRCRLLLRVGLLAVLLGALAPTSADPDLWGHVRFGHDIVAAGSVRLTDSYSFTSDRRWINHEWLAEVSMYAAYASAGAGGLVVLKLVLLLAMIGAVLWTLRRAGTGAIAADLLVVFVAIVTIAQGQHVRPQLFSLSLFAWLLVTVTHPAGAGGALRWCALPIMIVWVNVHGGWIVGAATLAVWAAVGMIVPISTREKLSACAVAALGAVITLVNPYGPDLWRFLGETVGFGREHIAEWQPVYRISLAYVILWALCAIAAIAAMTSGARQRTIDWRAAAVVLLFGAASFKVGRLLAFFGLSTTMLLGSQLAGLRRRPASAKATAVRRSFSEGGSSVSAAPSRLAAATALAIAFALAAAGVAIGVRNGRCIRIDSTAYPDSDATELIARNDLRGRMLPWFDWGEYAIWHLAPAMSVSMDGRRETVYSDSVIDQHMKIYLGQDGWREALGQLRPDYLWLPAYLPLNEQLKTEGWSPIFVGPRSVVMSRRDMAPAIPSRIQAERCFPGR